jgi:hypothetical protein
LVAVEHVLALGAEVSVERVIAGEVRECVHHESVEAEGEGSIALAVHDCGRRLLLLLFCLLVWKNAGIW